MEQDIIGTDSPVVKVKQKSRSWFQTLIAIIIVVIIVVVAYYVAAELAPYIWGAVVGTTGAATIGAMALGVLAVAAAGYAVGYATSYVTQGLAVAAGLQEEWDWKGMQDMGKSFAVSAVAAVAMTEWVNTLESQAGSPWRACRWRRASKWPPTGKSPA